MVKDLMLCLLLFALITSAVSAQRPPVAPPPTIFVFKNVAVVDVQNGRLLRDQTVVIEKGRITTVAPSKSVDVPTAAEVIDGRGLFLAPGFADMHVHLYTAGDIFTYLANGITTVRNMAGDPNHLVYKQRVESGELIGPRIITAGPIIETVLSHPDNQLVKNAVEARRAVAAQRTAGYDFIKVYNDISPETYDAVVDEARKLNLTVAGHVPYSIGLKRALSAPQRSIEHFRGYLHPLMPDRKPLAAYPDFRTFTLAWNDAAESKMRSLAEETARAGVWNCPTFTFTIHEMSPSPVHQAHLSRPETRSLSLSGLPKDRSKGYLSGFSEADFAAAQTGLKKQFRLLRELDRAGAGLLVGTDSWLGGFAFADELEVLAQAGLSPARIMRMATFDAARFLNETNERGSIAVGKVADLVLLNGDPLVDVRNVRGVVGVMRNGRFYDGQMIKDRLDNLRRERPR